MARRYAFVVSVILAFGLVSAAADAAAADGAAAELAGSPSTHFHASHLLDDVDGHHFKEKDARTIVAAKKSEIRKLSEQLLRAELDVIDARVQRDKLKKPALVWFFKPDVRRAVHNAQRKVNEKAREVERIHEIIHGLWLDIKPHYGVWSWLFVQDALGIVPYLARVAVEAAEAILALGLVALLIGGPLVCLIGMGIAWAFWFPLMVGVPAFGMSIYWLVQLPVMIAQYSPSVIEFILVYSALAVAIIALQSSLLRWFLPSSWFVATGTSSSIGPRPHAD